MSFLVSLGTSGIILGASRLTSLHVTALLQAEVAFELSDSFQLDP